MTNLVTKINSEENIVSLLRKGSYMKKEGALFYGECFRCSHYSMVASEGANICHCFSCNIGGTPVEIMLEVHKLLFKELTMLTTHDETIIQNSRAFGKRFLQLNDIVARHYHNMLLSSDGNEQRTYLLERGITPEQIEIYNIGLAINSFELEKEAAKYFCSKEDLQNFGIFGERGTDKFYSRIIFPLIDYRGYTIGFSGRSFGNTSKESPKYINSAKSAMYDKGSYFYGIHTALPHIKESVVLVEGQMDTIAMQSNGVPFTVGVSGTAFTNDHMICISRMLAEENKNIILAFDGDEAGIKATVRAIDIVNTFNGTLPFSSPKFSVSVSRSNVGKDASEHFNLGGKISEFTTISAEEFLSNNTPVSGTKSDANTFSE